MSRRCSTMRRRTRGRTQGGIFVVIKGPDRGEAVRLTGEPVSFGSGPQCSLVLTDKTVSRKHLEAQLVGDEVVMIDCGSTNGTFIQGSRFEKISIGFGAEVKLGRTVIKFLPDEEIVEPEPSAQTVVRLDRRRRHEDAADVHAARGRRRDERDRADRGRDRHRQGADRRGDPQPLAAQGRPVRRVRLRLGAARADRVDAVRPRQGQRSPARSPIAAARSPRRTAARSSSTRSARWRSISSRRCCACSTSARCARSARTRTRRSTCASSPRPTATCAPRSRRRRSARTSTTASR